MASRSEIIENIEALAVHCRPPLMGVEERGRWLNDWCEDLREFTAEAVKTGCTRWRQGVNPRFPLPGQLIPMVRAANVGNAPRNRPEIWRELSNEEYTALSLREKIRHKQIQASNAFSRAGPQTGHPDTMPEAWHMHRRMGANLSEEVRALRKKLAEMEAAEQVTPMLTQDGRGPIDHAQLAIAKSGID
jgi:hypothetical protein